MAQKTRKDAREVILLPGKESKVRTMLNGLAGLLQAVLFWLVCCVWVLSPDPGFAGGELRLLEADVDRGYPVQPPMANGLPTISDTYNPSDQGTDWPLDAFSARVVGHQSPGSIATPAMHSYDGDGNMEGITAFPPFAHQEDRTSLGSYTGAVGPAGGSTPESHPEVTAP